MRQMAKNRQKLWYALYVDQQETIATDEEGNVIYDEIDGEQVARTTGHWEPTYAKPVLFYGNINSGNVGEAIARSYGLSLAASEAVLCMRKGELPINEQTLIWYQNAPTYNEDGTVNYETADYRVKRVPPCLDEIIYLLGRLDNNVAS